MKPFVIVVPGLLALLFAGCAVEREKPDGGVHTDGFAVKGSPIFHGGYLRSKGYPLAECRACHGDDYGGGAVGVSCNSANCHSKGVEDCGTCHEGKSPPEPTTGGHLLHVQPCADCHLVPTNARNSAHPDGETAIFLSGLATFKSPEAAWNKEDGSCVNTFCHGAQSPPWDSAGKPVPCDTCHGAPPVESHARFAVELPPTGCIPCHSPLSQLSHLDGEIEFMEPACDQCHGAGENGAPPSSLSGSTDPTTPGVGAHARHLSETVVDRIGRVVPCTSCHKVPTSMLADGHLDATAPADVLLFGGEFDPNNLTCVVSCHWNKDPGPKWTDASGAARACDACHDFPPIVTRSGAPHPNVEGNVTICQNCHIFAPATHVDGNVDFLP